MNKEAKANRRRLKKQKKIVYDCTPEYAKKITDKFIEHFPYNFWQHKINAISEYIVHPEKIKKEVREKHDITLDDSIVERFKMEVHMAVFHSAETLFLILLGIYYEPNSFPFWVARCSSTQSQQNIQKLAENGLAGFVSDPEEWLLPVLYPAINSNHPNYEDAKKSTKFTVDYIQRLAKEYVDHVEYNSYKHGLRCNSGQARFQAKDEKSGKIILDSASDVIQFIEFTTKNDKKNIVYNFKNSTKTYDVNRDGNIIGVTTMVLSNIFHYWQLVIKRNLVGSDCKIKFIPYFFNIEKSNTVFEFDSQNSKGGFVTRFSINS